MRKSRRKICKVKIWAKICGGIMIGLLSGVVFRGLKDQEQLYKQQENQIVAEENQSTENGTSEIADNDKNSCDMNNKEVIDAVDDSADTKDESNVQNKDNTEDIDKAEDTDNTEDIDNAEKSEELEEKEYVGVSDAGLAFAYDAEIVAEKLRTYNYYHDEEKVVFLTFDDGTSSTVTPKILDILKEYDVKATFFVIGKTIEDGGETAKQLIKREFEEGHAIANHSYSHDYRYLYPNRTLNINNFVNDLKKTDDLLKDILGSNFKTRVFRCPGGYMSWKRMEPLKKYQEEENRVSIDWNSLIKDAEGKKKNANELFDCMLETSKQQDMVVLLMHDTYGKEETAKVLPKIIEYFKEKGYVFRTLV